MGCKKNSWNLFISQKKSWKNGINQLRKIPPKLSVLWIAEATYIYNILWMFLKLPVTRGPLIFFVNYSNSLKYQLPSSFFLYFCELLQFLKLPITRASVLIVLQPMCPSYPNSPNYQLPRVLLLMSCFVNYSNSLKYRLLGPLI